MFLELAEIMLIRTRGYTFEYDFLIQCAERLTVHLPRILEPLVCGVWGTQMSFHMGSILLAATSYRLPFYSRQSFHYT